MQARVPLGVPARLRSAFRVRRGWRSSAAWVSQCAGRCASRSRQGGGLAKSTRGAMGDFLDVTTICDPSDNYSK